MVPRRESFGASAGRKLFVIGEVEANEELNIIWWCGCGRFGIVLAFALGFIRLIGFAGTCSHFDRSRGGDAFKFEEKFFVEAIGLLPALEFVARQLDLFFVGCEVELNVDVGHEISLRRVRE